MRVKPLFVIPAVMLSFALSASLQAGERVYKWVDEKGVVHFTQQPPTTRKSETLEVRKGYSEPTKAEPTKEPTEEEKAAAAAAEFCKKARENLVIVSAEGEVRRKDEYGSSTVMSEEEKNLEKKRAQTAIDQHCKDSASAPGTARAPAAKRAPAN
jgi:Domain of unknown function (DUF4124)